ncbi:uncharacterized protein [Montipora foliosa]|uniref:uncharacterized protein n=1 Tax=Montipora foliosa TaxID=591990 RepID=UPI0035F199B7
MVCAEDFDMRPFKITLEFYKCSYPITILPLERRLFASEILTEEDITKPCISSFMSDILFQAVTASSSEGAEYCTNVWLERVEALHNDKSCQSFKKAMPNPLDFTQTGSAISASFQALSTQKRIEFLLQFNELLKVIPTQFYLRVAVGLFVYLELCKSFFNLDKDYCCAELEAWADTWLRLLVSSLLGKFKTSSEITSSETQRSISSLPVHHILCGLMIASNGYKILNSDLNAGKKIVKGLEHLILFSSGVTTLWLDEIKLYFG